MSDSTPTLLAQAQTRLAESLAALPPGRTGAAALVATTDGIKLAVATRLGDGWQVAGYVAYDGEVEAGAEVLFAWGRATG